jgi:L-Ala-D/L-Glu epimerase
VKIVAVRRHAYAVPFCASFVTAAGRWDTREGVIIELETNAGITGAGDCAPLPGGITIGECVRTLNAIAPALRGVGVEAATAHFDSHAGMTELLHPVRAAIDTAALDAQARAGGVSLARYLSPRAADEVAVNAVIGDLPVDAAYDAARMATDAGYRTIKLKAGAALTAEAEAERVRAVRDAAGPEVALRLDANGAWTPERALDVLRRLDGLGVEYVEQPIAARQIEAMAALRRASRTPVAADEDVTSVAAARAIIDAGAADVLVVKPAVTGGPQAAMEIAERCDAAGIGVVITTSLEVAAALALARACGLVTLDLLADDLIEEPLRAERGVMRVPDAPGLGVTLDRKALARHAPGAVPA